MPLLVDFEEVVPLTLPVQPVGVERLFLDSTVEESESKLSVRKESL